MKKYILLCLCFLFTACQSQANTLTPQHTLNYPYTFSQEDFYTEYEDIIPIPHSDYPVKIIKSGTYFLSGEYSHGIIIDVEQEDVRLILDDAHFSLQNEAMLTVEKANRVQISLEANSNSTVSVVDDTVIKASSDIVFNGSGSLSITNNITPTITSSQDIIFINGNYTIQGTVQSRNLIAVYEANFNLSSDKEVLRVNHPHQQGLIYFQNGTIMTSTPNQPFKCDGSIVSNAATLILDTKTVLDIPNSFKTSQPYLAYALDDTYEGELTLNDSHKTLFSWTPKNHYQYITIISSQLLSQHDYVLTHQDFQKTEKTILPS